MSEIAETVRQNAAEYTADTDEDRPLGGYAGLLVGYGGLAFLGVLLGRQRARGSISTRELALGSIATFRLTRTITSDPIASPLRMPFTRFEGVEGPSELDEKVRGNGLRHAVGELVSCPYCLAQWTATLLVIGLTVLPRFTRTAVNVLVMVAGADFLQLAYSKAIRAVE